MPTDADTWVPRAEAAARVGVHRNTVIEWEKRGMVRTRREQGPTGERVMVRVADLDRVAADRPDRPVSDELAACRERLAEVTAERDRLLAEILAIARGRAKG
jgi:hypothetical protein